MTKDISSEKTGKFTLKARVRYHCHLSSSFGLGKPQCEKCRVYLGIAQIAIDPPPPPPPPPPPSLKRALWGTLFPDRLEQMPFELQFSLHKCPKPSWQGFRPPKPSKCPFEHGQFFSK